MTDFSGFDLAPAVLRALEAEGYVTPTPIQQQALAALVKGRDLLGVAQTGTGKTAAFALPLLSRLTTTPQKARPHAPRALILAPTRELAFQIADSIKVYGRDAALRSTVVCGGKSIRTQSQAMARGVHILVATPGRLLDLMNQNQIRLDEIETFILDEADRMLDMGFIGDIKKIAAKTPASRQTVLFSATMPKAIQSLADGLLNDPIRVEVAPESTTAEKVEQHLLFVAKSNKRALLRELLNDTDIKSAIVFTRTKHGADRVARELHKKGVKADAIHGNKSQNQRQRALDDFKDGKVRVLVATDIAARGIDVDDVTHVFNFDLPNDPESYVHRIGRTARAGKTGVAISFCDVEEVSYLRGIEKVIRQSIPVIEDHPYQEAAPSLQDNTAPKRSGGPRGQRRGSKGNGRGSGQGHNQNRDGAEKSGAPNKSRNRRRGKGPKGGGGQRRAA